MCDVIALSFVAPLSTSKVPWTGVRTAARSLCGSGAFRRATVIPSCVEVRAHPEGKLPEGTDTAKENQALRIGANQDPDQGPSWDRAR